ncbi:hypothetical protein GCM10027168_44520 [Streptomyces capparidis]
MSAKSGIGGGAYEDSPLHGPRTNVPPPAPSDSSDTVHLPSWGLDRAWGLVCTRVHVHVCTLYAREAPPEPGGAFAGDGQ